MSDKMIHNPVIRGFNPDPSILRVEDDYYIATSTFEWHPGIQIHHSRDLVHWELIGHAVKRLVPEDVFSVPHHGKGIWAPCIRYHKEEFYIFYPDPDYGIYMTNFIESMVQL